MKEKSFPSLSDLIIPFFPSSPSDGERYNGGGSLLLLLLLRAGHGRPGEVLKVLRGGRGHPLHRPRRTLYQRPRPVHTIQEAGMKNFSSKGRGKCSSPDFNQTPPVYASLSVWV